MRLWWNYRGEGEKINYNFIIKQWILIFQAPFDSLHWFGSSGITYVTSMCTYEEFPILAECKRDHDNGYVGEGTRNYRMWHQFTI